MARQAMYENGEMQGGARTVKQTEQERDQKWGVCRPADQGKPVIVAWHQNEAMLEDRVIMLQIGNEKAYVNVDQLQKFIRWA